MAPANPVFLWWGDELVQFYNDAYSQSLRADKHPKAPGQLGAERLPKIWLTIAPQIDALIMRGEDSWHEDRPVSIYRDGKLEDVLHHQESNRYWPRPVGQRRDLENHKAKVRVRAVNARNAWNSLLDFFSARRSHGPLTCCCLRALQPGDKDDYIRASGARAEHWFPLFDYSCVASS